MAKNEKDIESKIAEVLNKNGCENDSVEVKKGEVKFNNVGQAVILNDKANELIASSLQENGHFFVSNKIASTINVGLCF